MNIIDTLYEENRVMLKYLEDRNEVSLKNEADNKLKKVLILSAASYFEYEIKNIIEQFVKLKSNNTVALLAFVKNTAVERNYHRFFDWESSNANKFWSLFGEDFKSRFLLDCTSDDGDLKKCAKAFIDIGQLRNCLVHNNFASFYIDSTSDEIYEIYKRAIVFIDYIRKSLLGGLSQGNL